nr:Gfo/Idh/MocA family oxidoreductase [Planosporangium thailandense]
MGRARHLEGALIPLRRSGVRSGDSRRELDLVLVGRRPDALRELAAEHGIQRWSTSLDEVLSDPDVDVYFDAQRSGERAAAVRAAIAAGKHVYCEKPLAPTRLEAVALARAAQNAGVRTGVVQDKLFTPGFRALGELVRAGRLGRVVDVRGDFGYWVHTGEDRAPQRPSWNYRRADGGEFIGDLFSHWFYLLDLIRTPVSVAALGATHVPQRHDEHGQLYDVDVEDLAHVLVRLDDRVTGVVSSSWIQRPATPFTLTVHGSRLSARATPDGCAVADLTTGDKAPSAEPPWRPVDVPNHGDEFLSQWGDFLAHVAFGTDYRLTFSYAARAAAFCDAIRTSLAQGTWCDIPYEERGTR